MAWSPRELGELADTSRRTVRHYQEIGLLPEPERRSNGYRQYGVAHLLQLLRIRRLARLGLPLPQIAAIDRGDEDLGPALRALDVELASRTEELERTRLELARMLARAEPDDLPTGLDAHAGDLPPAEQALLVVLSQILTPPALQAYLDILGPYRESGAVIEFDELAAHGDERTRARLAQGIADHLGALSGDHGGQVEQIRADLRVGPVRRRRAVNQTIGELYNDAQIDVLSRARRLVSGTPVVIRAV